MKDSGGVAQLVRACGSYPQCPGFKSLHRHHFLPSLTMFNDQCSMFNGARQRDPEHSAFNIEH